MKVVTCVDKAPTASYYAFDSFMGSAQRYGFTPMLLGWGQPWGGLGRKPGLLKQAIDQGKITDEYIIFCDGFDVIFQDDPTMAAARAMINFPHKIVANAEKNCFPDATLADKHSPSSTPFRYLNTGFMVGPTDVFLDMLKLINADAIPPDHMQPDGKRSEPNDQGLIMTQFVKGELPMVLDTQCMICQTLGGVEEDELDFSGLKISNKLTGETPVAIHANGRKEEWLPKIRHKLAL